MARVTAAEQIRTLQDLYDDELKTMTPDEREHASGKKDRWVTSPLLAGATGFNHGGVVAGIPRSHLFRVIGSGLVVECACRVKPESACDSSMWTHEPPTCYACLRRYRKLARERRQLEMEP
jgi:hypothetical protein